MYSIWGRGNNIYKDIEAWWVRNTNCGAWVYMIGDGAREVSPVF